MRVNVCIWHDVVHLRVPDVANIAEAEKWLEQQAKAWYGERWGLLPTHIVITSATPEATKVKGNDGQIVNLLTTWDVEGVAGDPELLRQLGYNTP